jgi:hypothetical protein
MLKSLQTLKDNASDIENETKIGANTAKKVGQLFYDILDKVVVGEVISGESVPHMEIDTGGDSFIGEGETKNITCKVVNSYGQDITNTVNAWTITRDSGHSADDSAWNIAHISFAGVIAITLDDLGQNSDNNISTLFTITAVGTTTVTGTLEI